MKNNGPPRPSSRLRRLSAEEVDLWLNVTTHVVRLPGHEPLHRPAAETVKEAAAPPPAPAPQITLPPRPTKPPALAPLERRVRQKLARGRIGVDAAVDLHGLRQHEAFSALRRFLAEAQRDGAKLVLVVTGKGERSTSADAGVLRRTVPEWLRAPDLRPLVVGFEEAARPHGGAGALYVRLRRRDRPLT